MKCPHGVAPSRLALLLFVACFVSLALSDTSAAQSGIGTTRTFDEWPIPTANSGARHILVVGPSMLVTERDTGKIGKLTVQTTATFTEWTLPTGSHPDDLAQGFGSPAIFTDETGFIGGLNINTNVLTIWTVPTANATPTRIALSGTTGTTFYFTEATGNRVALLNTSTNQITEWAVPTPTSAPQGISIGKTNQVWFVEEANKIGQLNTSTNTITEWTVPSVSQLTTVRFFQNAVYFGDFLSGVVGRLNTTTNVITEWTSPAVPSQIGDLTTGPPATGTARTVVYFTEFAGNNIASLDPTQPGTDTKVTPAVTSVSPVITSVTPATIKLASVKTTVAATTTVVIGTASGAFEELPVPTPASGPRGIQKSASQSFVFFVETDANKVGEIE